MLVNLAIITLLCHHPEIASQGMKSAYTHFQQIQSSTCLLSDTQLVHSTITLSLIM